MDAQPHYTYIDNQGYVCEKGEWDVDGVPHRWRCRKTHKDCPDTCLSIWFTGAMGALISVVMFGILMWATGATLTW